MNKVLISIFGSSPKTTITGLISGLAVALYPVFTTTGFNIQTDWKNLVVAAGLYFWGRIQKDTNGVTATEGQVMANKVLNKPIDPSVKL